MSEQLRRSPTLSRASHKSVDSLSAMSWKKTQSCDSLSQLTGMLSEQKISLPDSKSSSSASGDSKYPPSATASLSHSPPLRSGKSVQKNALVHSTLSATPARMLPRPTSPTLLPPVWMLQTSPMEKIILTLTSRPMLQWHRTVRWSRKTGMVPSEEHYIYGCVGENMTHGVPPPPPPNAQFHEALVLPPQAEPEKMNESLLRASSAAKLEKAPCLPRMTKMPCPPCRLHLGSLAKSKARIPSLPFHPIPIKAIRISADG